MKLNGINGNNEKQTIEFFGNDLPKWFYNTSEKKVGISVSGGADSALLLYLTAYYFKNFKIVPSSGWENMPKYPLKERPGTLEYAINVVKWVKNKIPDANILDHYIYEINLYDENIQCEANKTYEDRKGTIKELGLTGIQKQIITRNEHRKLFNNKMIDIMVGGLTSNPPKKVLDSWSEEVYVEPRRSNNKRKECMEGRVYKPFINVDKKFLNSLYEQHNILELRDITQSCVGRAKETNWWTKPCKKCFWCWERKWAFGSYDGGII
tara:strand:- start:765 stop:1562 length:798 start_codon:yes stop_codon:yes gene_type:complete